MKFTCKNCQREIEVEKPTSYNQFALQNNWCEKCWYYEHWRPYKLWIAERNYPIHGWAEVDPPDDMTIYYEAYEEINYKEFDWRGRFKREYVPPRHEMSWLGQDEKSLAKELSVQYKTTVLVCGQRPEETDTVFCIAYNGQLFEAVKEESEE